MTAARAAALLFGAIALVAAAPFAVPLDSQVILQRYFTQLAAIEAPKNMIFAYTVTQAGATVIDQSHVIYRSGDQVRDETLATDGQPLRAGQRPIRVSRYRDRYAVGNVAPRPTEYSFLFERTIADGDHFDYIYSAVPLVRSSGFVVDTITIDGRSFLPDEIAFHTSNGTVSGIGSLRFSKIGAHWMAVLATVTASVDGKPARERIALGGYRFPASLPRGTFQTPKPLPKPILPTF